MSFQQPADLDTREFVVNNSRRRAEGSPWTLSDHDIWRLDMESLETAISELVNYVSYRTTDPKTTPGEAAILAKLKYHWGKRYELENAEQLAAQLRPLSLAQVAEFCRRRMAAREQNQAESRTEEETEGGQGN